MPGGDILPCYNREGTKGKTNRTTGYAKRKNRLKGGNAGGGKEARKRDHFPSSKQQQRKEKGMLKPVEGQIKKKRSGWFLGRAFRVGTAGLREIAARLQKRTREASAMQAQLTKLKHWVERGSKIRNKQGRHPWGVRNTGSAWDRRKAECPRQIKRAAARGTDDFRSAKGRRR